MNPQTSKRYEEAMRKPAPVSYTHLDVYKRQAQAFVFQIRFQVFPNHFLIVNDQNPARHDNFSRTSGRRMLKQAPCPGLEVTDNRPLCCSVTMK